MNFTLEEIKKVLDSVMKPDSPLGQRILSKFENHTPDEQASNILAKMDRNRFNNSGYVHALEGEIMDIINSKIDERIKHKCTESEFETFRKGYAIGMGATKLNRL